jgi:hypothetical protein
MLGGDFMRLLHIAVAFVAAAVCLADTITLKDGRVIQGTYLGGSARQVRVGIGDQIQTLDVTDVARIEFGDGAPVAEPAPPPVAREERREERRDESPQPPVLGITLPAGTSFVIRMIDAVDSQTAKVGQNFAGSLDAPVVDSSGQTIIPRGADVVLKLVDAKQSGKIAGRTELALSMMSVRVNGQMVDIRTQTVTERSTNRAGRSAGAIGGGAVGGAILGGILGGGKGAAIGAGAGGAGGAAVELATSGQRVRVPSETRLRFVLDNPVRI